jgi:hypothetical protein
MIYFIALIPATGLSIAGYFVLYLSNRSEGAFRTFGKYLGFWAFTLAGLIVLGAIFAAAHGGRGGAMIGIRAVHGGMHCPWRGEPRFFGHGDVRPEAATPVPDGTQRAPGAATPPATPAR